MDRLRRGALLGALALCFACGGGGGGDGGGSVLPADCPTGPFLGVSPVAISSISSIVVLGNLNPPGHTFPTDHTYFYLVVPPGETAPAETTLFAPGDLSVVSATATEHLTAGYTDYGITLAPCQDVTIEFGHVTSLAPSVFGDVASLAGWTLRDEYTTGGQTYRQWYRAYGVPVAAGTVLGTAGGRTGQWALDVGAHDLGALVTPVANMARWTQSLYLHTVCPLAYYEDGPVLDDLEALVSRVDFPGDPYPCGRVLWDVPGTAQGCWFVEGTTSTYPEDPHLALVWSNRDPLLAVVSMGTSVTGFGASARTFSPLGSGRRNRPFTQVTPDGLTYGYELVSPPGVLVVRMPDAVTLWVEYLPAATSDPATWVFTSGRTVFVR